MSYFQSIALEGKGNTAQLVNWLNHYAELEELCVYRRTPGKKVAKVSWVGDLAGKKTHPLNFFPCPSFQVIREM